MKMKMKIRYALILIMFSLFTTSCKVGDDEAPSVIDDLRVSSNMKIFNWTSPGDDGKSGTARLYLIRYFESSDVKKLLGVDSLEEVSESVIEKVVQENFDKAIQIPEFVSPSPAGTTESVAVPRLDFTGSKTFYFAVSTNDEVGNNLGPSNVVKVSTPLVQAVFRSEDEESCFGTSATVAEVGGKEEDEDDIDEFIGDLIVGDPCLGKVYIFFGGADIIGDKVSVDPGEADVIIIGDPNESFGFSLTGIGNFAEKSTFEEFAIGAPDANNGTGKVYIFYGREDLPKVVDLTAEDKADIVIFGDSSGDRFGFSLERRGTNNIFVGAPGALDNRGKMYSFNGPDLDEQTFAEDAEFVVVGEIGEGMFGYDISDGGDIDGSSPDDYIVSAPGLGRVYVVFDTGDIDLSQSLSDVLVIQGDVNEGFGRSIAGGFDIDGFIPDDDDEDPDIDEDTDIVVGAPYAEDGRGSVFVYKEKDLENALETKSSPPFALRIDGVNPGDNFGMSVELISDINPNIEIEEEDTANVMDQDVTNADIIVGAPGAASGEGRVYVFFGKEGFSGSMDAQQADLTLFPLDEGKQGFGLSVFKLGDINDDSFVDFGVLGGNGKKLSIFY